VAANLTASRGGSAAATGRQHRVRPYVNYCECHSVRLRWLDMRVFQAAPKPCRGAKRVCRSRQRATKAMPTPNNGCRLGSAARTPPLRAFFSPPAKIRPGGRRDHHDHDPVILAMMRSILLLLRGVQGLRRWK